jgi:SAM-dependent methyltransferase
MPKNFAVRIRSFAHSGQRLWTKLNDATRNISTTDFDQRADKQLTGWWRGPHTDAIRHNDNYGYASPDYYYIRKAIRILQLVREDVFYDIGCGKGRVLCLVARHRIKKAVGIEILENLCVVARQNATRVRGRCCPIEVRLQDAAQADLPDGTVFYLFNPFGRETMGDFTANISRSLTANPRKLKIVYHNSVHADVLNSCKWLRLFNSFKTLSGKDVLFYETCNMG